MTAFFMAWMMFFYIPCPVTKWDENKKQDMLVCFPIVGLMIGIIDLAVYQLAEYFDFEFLGSALMSFMPWMLCGFIHLDGFMDCADAVLSCRDEKRRLEILKDSHVGAFAVISVLILGILSFAAWRECIFKINPICILLMPVVSRAVAGICVLSYKPLEQSSYKSIHDDGIKKSNILILFIELVIALAVGFVFAGLQGIALLFCAVSVFLTVVEVKRKLGGMSGDVSGCAVCISELMGVIALCFL